MATQSLTTTGVIVASDRAYQGLYTDLSGPAVTGWLQSRELFEVGKFAVVADDFGHITEVLGSMLSSHDLIIVTGGTGLGPRDITPQAIHGLADYAIPGIGELLRSKSEKFSANSYLSRCGAWVKNQKLILAIPGNPKAAVEQLDILDDLLPHMLMSLKGECKHRRRVEP